MDAKRFSRIACYVRVSTENQIENYSIEEQIERLKAYCEAKDWNIYKIYTDAGYSGGNLNRPALKQMMQDIGSNKIDMVVVYKLDRLSRSQKDTLMLIEDKFLNNNIEFVSMNENFDTTTPFGRAMIGMLSVFAQLEKDQITERFTMGRIGRSKAGLYHGGSIAPTGYRYIDGNLLVDENKASQVKEVFDLFLSGYSINAIHRKMNDKYGGWNSHSLVRNVLRNNVYIGKIKFKNQIYNGVHTAIITNEQFYKVQELLNSMAERNKKTSFSSPPFRAAYLLSGFLYCKKCGSKYSANHGYYKCYSRSKSDKKYIIDPNCKNGNWKINELDALIIHEIAKLKINPAYIECVISPEFNRNVTHKSVKERIKSINIQISKLISLYQLEDVPIDDISSRIIFLQKEKDTLQKQWKLKQESIYTEKKDIKLRLNQFNEIFMGNLIEMQRLFIGSIIQAIYIDDKNIHINWRI